MARYEIELEYLVRENDCDDGEESFEYKTIEKELSDKEAENILCGSVPTFEVPVVENSKEVLIVNIRKIGETK